MFNHSVCRNLVIRITTIVLGSRTTIAQLHFLQNPSLIITRFISTISKSNHFTVDYLVNTCGLSPESALKASKRIVLKSTTNPDSVLFLFKSYGLTEFHISKLISASPSLLLAKTDKTLKPKLVFFTNLGISGPDLGKILCRDPNYLKRSLEKQIIPSILFLRRFLGTTDNLAFTLNKLKWMLCNTERIMGPNIAILRYHGVPECNISKFMMMDAKMLCINPDRFNKAVLDLKEMGVCPSSTGLVRCLWVLLGAKKPIWDGKLVVYKSFGWSEDEVLSVFKKQPMFMAYSEKKISLALDFFMNSLNWTRGDLANNPSVISHSLEKRVIPRNYVLQILLSKELITKNSMPHAFIISEHMFMKKYVIKYCHEIPDLLKVYQSKMGTQDSKIGSEDGCTID